MRMRSMAPLAPVLKRMSCAAALVVASTSGWADVVPRKLPVLPFQAVVVALPVRDQPVLAPPPAASTALKLASLSRPALLAMTMRS